MSKRYFIWDNTRLQGEAPAWIELNGRDFYRFVKSPEAEGRYFTDMGDVVLESTEKAMKKNRAYKDHEDYIAAQEAAWEFISLYGDEANGHNGEETIPDVSQNTEDMVMRLLLNEEVSRAIKSLPEIQRKIVEDVYLSETPTLMKDIAAKYDLSSAALSMRLKRIKIKLKNSVNFP